jgi:beta-lactamase regulating signal transducer with metallopeptidase domain
MNSTILTLISTDVSMWLFRLTFSVALIGIAAVMMMVLPGRTSAAYRHRVWALSLVASLVLPAFIPWLPEFRIGPQAPSRPAENSPDFVSTLEPALQTKVSHASSRHALVADAGIVLRDSPNRSRIPASTPQAFASAAVATHRTGKNVTPGREEAPSQAPSLSVSAIWLLILISPAIWELTRAALSARAAGRLSSAAEPVRDLATLRVVSEISARLGWHRDIRTLHTEQSAIPLCLGWWKPAIVLPSDWQKWPEITLRSVLAHEIAHIVRRDVAWQHVARVASALYWFHPAVWLAARQLRIEREAACDDCVLSIVTPASDYARVLVYFAQRLRSCPALTADAVAMACSSPLENRVRAILDGRRARGPVRPVASRLLLAAMCAVAVAAAIVSPAARAVSNDAPRGDRAIDGQAPHFLNNATLTSNEVLQAIKPSDPDAVNPSSRNRAPKPSAEITGRVVLRSNRQRGVPRAKVLGVPSNADTPYASAVCDAEGHFRIARIQGTSLYLAQNDERTVAGIAQIPAQGHELEIAIGSAAAVHGRLIEVSTGKPVPNRQLNFGVVVDGHMFSVSNDGRMMFCGVTRTDAHGKFTLAPLAPGWKYQLESGLIVTGGEFAVLLADSSKTLTEFTSPSSGTAELGNIEISMAASEFTLAQGAMRHDKPVDDLIKTKLEKARISDRHVLIVAGTPSEQWCQIIFLEAEDNPQFFTSAKQQPFDALLQEALRNYALLGLDLSGARTAAAYQTFLAKRQFSTSPIPSLAVLDTTGRLISSRVLQEPDKQGLSHSDLLEWLNRNAPPFPDGEALVKAARVQAKAQKKHILVRESAPRCDPCEQLSRYLEKHKQLLEKDYVLVKLDRRFPNACGALNPIQQSPNGGVPWMVILDSNGKPLVDSNSPQGNIGYPESAREVSYFEWMLRATAQRLSDQEIKTLVRGLK